MKMKVLIFSLVILFLASGFEIYPQTARKARKDIKKFKKQEKDRADRVRENTPGASKTIPKRKRRSIPGLKINSGGTSTPIEQASPPPISAQQAIKKQDNSKSVEDEIENSDFIYKPNGRRDPFWDLLKGKSVKIKREEKEGIAGLLIDELELEGIIFNKGKYLALFKGPDGRPYDVRVGDNVYDGEIIKISVNSVVFKRMLTIALGGTKEKIITKRLTPEEEASKQ